MSDEKKGLGLFVSKVKPAAPAGPAALTPKKNVSKRWMYVAGGAVGVVVLASSVFGNKPAPRAPVAKEAGMVSVTPPNADKAAFESKFSRDLEENRAQTEMLKRELEALRSRQAAEAATPTPPAGIVPPPVAGNTGGLGTIGGATPPAHPAPPAPPTPAFQPPASQPPSALPGLPPVPQGVGGGAPLSFDAPEKPKSEQQSSASGANGQPDAAAKVRYSKNASAGVLPVGSFASVSLLNGLDAGTSSATQSNPLPVLMNITDQAVLPGSAKYRLKSCFILGTAYGDLSAERVYGRISRISCVDKRDRLVLNAEVQGYLVDSDGKLGMRGLISDRQGARLGKALLAGFAQGLAGALGTSQGTVLSNLTSGDVTNSVNGSAALRASGLSGAQTAASQLAEFYLKEAQNIFPVISVDVGRTGTVVFTSPVKLDWADGESQFVQQVTPKN